MSVLRVANREPIFREFIRSAIQKHRPDIIILRERKGEVYDYLHAIPGTYKGLVAYWEYFRFAGRKQLSGKIVFALDDIVQHGTTLEKMRNYCKQRNVKEIHTFALVANKSSATDWMQRDPELKPCLALPQDEFVRATQSLTLYMLSKGKPLDRDHLQLVCRCQEQIDLQAFIRFLSRYGLAYEVPSPAEAYGISMITLDRPIFFSLKGYSEQLGIQEEGSVKIRFYVEATPHQTLITIVPMVFPRMIIDPTKPKIPDAVSVGRFAPINELFPDIDEWNNEEKCEATYIWATLNMAGWLALPCVRLLKHFFDEKKTRYAINVVQQDLVRSYGVAGGNCSHRLNDDIARIVDNPESSSSMNLYQIDPHEFIVGARVSTSSRQEFIEKVLGLIRADLEKRLDNDDSPGEKGLSFSELVAQMPNFARSDISEALDILLDLGVIKPINEIRAVSAGQFLCVRSYTLGENGEHKNSVARRPDRPKREQVARTIAAIIRQFDELDQERGKKTTGQSTFPIHKALANLFLDWGEKKAWSMQAGELGYQPIRAWWGPRIEAIAVGVFNEAHIFRLAKDFRHIFTFDEANKVFVLSPSWDKNLEEHFDGGDETVSLLDSYGQIYATLHSMTVQLEPDVPHGDDPHDPKYIDALTALSFARTWRHTYWYGYENLREWIQQFELFMDAFKHNLDVLGPRSRHFEIILATIGQRHAALLQKLLSCKYMKKISADIQNNTRKFKNQRLLNKILRTIDYTTEDESLQNLWIAYEIASNFTNFVRALLTQHNWAEKSQSATRGINQYLTALCNRAKFLDRKTLDALTTSTDRHGTYLGIAQSFEKICGYFSANLSDIDLPGFNPEAFDQLGANLVRVSFAARKWALDKDLRDITVVFADLSPFTGLFEGPEDVFSHISAASLIDELDKEFEKKHGKYKESQVQKIEKQGSTGGDAWIYYFRSPSEAVKMAIDMQKVVRSHSALDTSRALALKVGIARGLVIPLRENLISDAINTAQRLSNKARPDRILLTEDVYTGVGEAIPNIQFSNLGKQQVIRDNQYVIYELKWKDVGLDIWA